MKWWVWLIVIVLVISGVFWLYVYLTKDKAKNESLIKAREAKAEKALEKLGKEIEKELEPANAGTP
ncbi:MAG TPA: hypothetical protein VFU05_13600 [Cyclobacteriaceae bacterium]|nr:hypothetical protein [Cyclobacteriaceae bacterium]